MASESATRDPVTGVYTREAFEPALRDALALAQETLQPLTLLVLDLDYFKSVNDAFGHARGDRVLAEVARRMLIHARASDRIFRYGGDEFVVLAPGASRDQALALAHRLLHAIGGEPFPGEPPFALSASIGLADFPNDALSYEALFDRADRALLSAKRRGRGQVSTQVEEVSPEAPSEPGGRLVERDAALGSMHWFLDELESKRRGVLMLEGPSASGRTRLLEEVHIVAMLRGYQVLSLRGLPDTGGQPLEAFRHACRHWPEFPALPRAARTDPDRLEQLLRAYLRQRPSGVLLLGDDVERLDQLSLDVLTRLTSLDAPRTLGLILASTPGFWRELPPPNAPLRDTVYLEPLTREGVRAFVRSFLHWEAPEPLLDWLVTQSRGLPGAVHRVVEELVSTRQVVHEGRGWALSPSFAEMVGAGRTPAHAARSGSLEPSEPFFGREGELYHLKHLLERTRLLTLTGPGGVGKTRLALRLAHDQRDHLKDGACLVSLASLSAPEQVAPAIALALRLPETPARECLDALKEHLRDKRLLLVLDNFEHVAPAASAVTDLLAACPDLHVVTTSRAELRVFGETPFLVQPLPVPDAERLPPVEVLPEYSGVALFLARARATCPDFALTPGNAPVVAALCSRLEGLPLALELAAARVSSGALDTLAGNLPSALELTRGPASSGTGRQHSLDATIQWSIHLLPPDARALFAYLGVFRGGWTMEAAAAVASALWSQCTSREPARRVASPSAVVERNLELLANHSLIRRERGGGRFTILETLREYALERLTDTAEVDAQAAHARYYLDLLERTEPDLTGARQAEALDLLEAEHSNLRAALEWWLCRGETLPAMLAVGALWRFWTTRGHLVEGVRWSRRVLDNGDTSSDHGFQSARGKALLSAGILEQFVGEFERANGYLTEALECCRASGNTAIMASVENNLGNVAELTGDLELACRHWEASLQLRRELNDRSGAAVALHNLAGVFHVRGAIDDAVCMYEESIQLWREVGDRLNTGNSLVDLSTIARQGGDLSRATVLLEQCADGWNDLGYVPGLVVLVDMFGDLAMERGAVIRAVQLWGAAEAAREAIGQPGDNSRPGHSRMLQLARRALDAPSFHSHWDAGRQLGVDEALALARSPLAPEQAAS